MFHLLSGEKAKLQAPVNRGDFMRLKKIIAGFKMTAAKKSLIGRQRTWMGTGQYTVIRIGNQHFFLSGVGAPKKENHGLFPLI